MFECEFRLSGGLPTAQEIRNVLAVDGVTSLYNLIKKKINRIINLHRTCFFCFRSRALRFLINLEEAEGGVTTKAGETPVRV